MEGGFRDEMGALGKDCISTGLGSEGQVESWQVESLAIPRLSRQRTVVSPHGRKPEGCPGANKSPGHP